MVKKQLGSCTTIVILRTSSAADDLDSRWWALKREETPQNGQEVDTSDAITDNAGPRRGILGPWAQPEGHNCNQEHRYKRQDRGFLV
ncbi:hypothetical protein NMY22_g14603 [Coprinellus aureogranulatus]|nr:hypothetical protein NMY22_g14603 [Coprinellus aureogranulatus]